MKPLLASMGDPAGIGPEILGDAWARLGGSVPFAVLGCARTLESYGTATQCIQTLSDIDLKGPLPVLDRPLPAPLVRPGHPNTGHAQAVVDWISEATHRVQAGEASALVTAPINKKALMDGAGFPFPGHTEFLADLTGASRPIMMLAGPELRVVPVTIHIALDAVAEALTPSLLEETLRGTDAALRSDFGITTPRIAVAGLNPHAGEQGAMGRQELDMIAPLIERLRADGLNLTGPLPADTMFHAAARSRYDVAVCMYHDQALVPLKTLAFDDGVNVTLGLPIVRTSPDHGTAYDIAGLGIAKSDSMIAALRMAAEISRTKSA
jgi:4-hydroxythreonine-4-phosphate dehydrogenase